MTHIHHSGTAKVPLSRAFEYVTNPHHLADWMFGIQHVRIVGDVEVGLGAKYDIAIHLGATLRSTIEVTDWEQDRLFYTESRAGLENQIRCQFREISGEETEIVFDIDYFLPGGLAGRALGKVISPFISLAITHSDVTLRTTLERQHLEESERGR